MNICYLSSLVHVADVPGRRALRSTGSSRLRLTLSPPIPLMLYTLPYWSNPCTSFDFWHSGTLALMTERQSARMSKIKTGGLDQYGAERFRQ